jgi:hypothetical protein
MNGHPFSRIRPSTTPPRPATSERHEPASLAEELAGVQARLEAEIAETWPTESRGILMCFVRARRRRRLS